MKPVVLYAGIILAVIGALYGVASTATTTTAPDPLGAIAIGICALALVLASDKA
jgi:hypothetical protein